jgi:exodeoxyribonuclease VII large subunit
VAKAFGIPPESVVTVSQFNQMIKATLSTLELRGVIVIGEVSNFHISGKGYIYFNLIEEDGLVKCAMFKTIDEIKIEDGVQVIVCGRTEYYVPRSEVEIIVSKIFPVGEGIYYLRLKQLKERLQKEGYFDYTHKRQLPSLPTIIGVVTSITGAVIQDILMTVEQRFPNMNVKISPCSVQGPEAVESISKAIQILNSIGNLDVIILARGGGSNEDLSAFNTEELAKVVYHSKIPIVCGVGHGPDTTIVDLVADAQFVTPTAAAKAAVPERENLLLKIKELEQRLEIAYVKHKVIKRKEAETKVYQTAALILFVFLALIVIYLLIR